MKCPYCAGEIPEGVAKCMHCGEWLDRSRAPTARVSEVIVKPDYSAHGVYKYQITRGFFQRTDKLVLGLDAKDAAATAKELLPEGFRIDFSYGFHLLPKGRFSCPSCKSEYTECRRNIGCVVLFIVFISLGLGLLAIPFLPFTCFCFACGHKWRT